MVVSYVELESQDREHQLLSKQNRQLMDSVIYDTYKTTMRTKMAFNDDTELTIDLNNRKMSEFIGKLINQKLKLQNMKRLSLKLHESSLDSTGEFIKECFPDYVGYFELSWDQEPFPITHILEEISQAGKRVRSTVKIHGLQLSSSDLEGIIKSCLQCDTLIISNCQVYTEQELDLQDLENCKLEVIQFCKGDKKKLSNWIEHPNLLENILNGIASSPLMPQSEGSLREVQLLGVRQEGVDVLKDVGEEGWMEGVNIIFH